MWLITEKRVGLPHVRASKWVKSESALFSIRLPERPFCHKDRCIINIPMDLQHGCCTYLCLHAFSKFEDEVVLSRSKCDCFRILILSLERLLSVTRKVSSHDMKCQYCSKKTSVSQSHVIIWGTRMLKHGTRTRSMSHYVWRWWHRSRTMS